MGNGSIFISHSHADRDTAWRLVGSLESQNFNVWLDRLQIEPSDDWPSRIEAGLEEAEVILVIWNRNAKNSEWVGREIARASKRDIPIVPLIFDDTEVDIHLERRQYIDSRGGWFEWIQELFIFLSLLIEQGQIQAQVTQDPWRRLSEPDQRNRFLYDNHYSTSVDRDDFAHNNWTRRLHNAVRASEGRLEWEQAARFATIVCVPVDHTSIPVNFGGFDSYFGKVYVPDSGQRSVAPDAPQWFRFPLILLDYPRHDNRDYVRFHPVAAGQGVDGTKLRAYLRFSQGGGIELGMTESLIQKLPDGLVVLDYVGILGVLWQFLYLANDLYCDLLKYDGKFQLLLNVVGTMGGVLANFAEGKGNRQWASTLRLK